eukprot:scaffold836_cov123-Isochrysis_galbana.AAC.2
MYALQWLPLAIRDDRPLLQQWIDNNMSYLDALVLEVFQYGDADFRRDSWSTYQNLHMCRLGVCPQWLWSLDVYSLSTPTRLSSIAAPCASTHSFPILISSPPVPLQWHRRSSKCATLRWSVSVRAPSPLCMVPMTAGRTHTVYPS